MSKCACPSINPYECTEIRYGLEIDKDDLCQCFCHNDWFNQYKEYVENITSVNIPDGYDGKKNS